MPACAVETATDADNPKPTESRTQCAATHIAWRATWRGLVSSCVDFAQKQLGKEEAKQTRMDFLETTLLLTTDIAFDHPPVLFRTTNIPKRAGLTLSV